MFRHTTIIDIYTLQRDDILRDIKQAEFNGYPHYVYGLARPDGTVFYVGKGKDTRLFAHEWQVYNNTKPSGLKHAKNPHKLSVIAKILKSGEFLRYTIYAFFSEGQDALNFEAELIESIGTKTDGGVLTNYTAGGGSGVRRGHAAVEHARIVREVTATAEWRRKQKEGTAASFATPKRQAVHRALLDSLKNHPTWRKNHKEGCKLRSQSESWKENTKKARQAHAERTAPIREECKRLRSHHALKRWVFPKAVCSYERWQAELEKILCHIATLNTKEQINDNFGVRLGDHE